METDPEAFFPEKGGSTRAAKAVCRRCEVRMECLAYALENDERFGIWGGMSERERRRVKRAAPYPAASSPGTCRKGLHVMDEGNIYAGPDGLGRHCRACKQAAYARARDASRRRLEYVVSQAEEMAA